MSSFKIVDAAAPDAIQICFSSRQYHSKVQEDQLEFVRAHKIITGPWVSDADEVSVFIAQTQEEFLTYMSARLRADAVTQIRSFIQMPTGAVGIVPTSGQKENSALIVRLVDNLTFAGPVPGLRALRRDQREHARIALAENLPEGEPFHGLYRHVEVLGELSDAEVRSWAFAQPVKPENPGFFTRNPWTHHIAGAKSFDTSRKLWLASATAAHAEVPVTVAEHLPGMSGEAPEEDLALPEMPVAAPLTLLQRIARLELSIVGENSTDDMRSRVRRLEVTLADLHADGFDIMTRVKNLETLAGI